MPQPLPSWLLRRPVVNLSQQNLQKPCDTSETPLLHAHPQTFSSSNMMRTVTCTYPSVTPVAKSKMLQSPWKAMVLEFRSEQLSRARANHRTTSQCAAAPLTQSLPEAAPPATMKQPQCAPNALALSTTVIVLRTYSLYPHQLSASSSCPQFQLTHQAPEGWWDMMLWERSAVARPTLQAPSTSVAAAKTTKKPVFPKPKKRNQSGWRLLTEEEMRDRKTLSDEIAELAAGRMLSPRRRATLHIPYRQYRQGSN